MRKEAAKPKTARSTVFAASEVTRPPVPGATGSRRASNTCCTCTASDSPPLHGVAARRDADAFAAQVRHLANVVAPTGDFVERPVEIDVDDFEPDAARLALRRRTRRRAEVKIASHRRLSRQTAGHGNYFNVQPFVPVEPQLFGDEVRIMDHAKAGERSSQSFEVWHLRQTKK